MNNDQNSVKSMDLGKLPQKIDDRGVLTYLEEGKNVPFNILSVYIISSEKPSIDLSLFPIHEKLGLITLNGSCDLGNFQTREFSVSFIEVGFLNELTFSKDFLGVLLLPFEIKHEDKIHCFKKEFTPLTYRDVFSSRFPRIFFISDVTKGSMRGGHAHRTCEQVLVLLKGTCKLEVEKEGVKQKFDLDRSSFYVNTMTWLELTDFSEDAVLMVLSNELFLESGYIRDYSVFKDLVC